MKIDDLIRLLNNRLREFQLSRDYARMNGDLERMNIADKEVLALENTLFQLNLLVDTSKSVVVKETTLAEALTDGSISVLGEYDITPYATDPDHEEKVMNILSKMEVMDTMEKIDDYIKSKYLGSPVTGEMVWSAAEAYAVDARLMMAIMEQDSRFGTAGLAIRTLNPGNVGNDDDGNIRTYESWQAGVTAVAEWLSRHRISEIISGTPEETATSTPATATTTPVTATSTTPFITPTTSTTTPVTATSTPPVEDPPITIDDGGIDITTTSTTTPTTATTTPTTASTTPPVADTPITIDDGGIDLTTTSTTTPVTATSTAN